VLVQETEERQRRTYIAQNANDTPRDLVIEHPARAGWTIDSTVSPAESTPDWHRFRVTVPPGVSTTFVVDERRPIQSQYQVSSLTDALLAVLVREGTVDPTTEAQLREVIDRKGVIARLDGDLATRRTEIERIGRDQERLRENMRVLKGTSEERQLLQRYVRQLDEQETRLAAVRAELQALETERATAAAELAAFIRTLGT
ncbi:MAG TPA: hypothetical protein VMM93_00140, partial [Vicinamibacterales bacterium]|nr:hypothetical protein [Vicinamibacterales bacterium]